MKIAILTFHSQLNYGGVLQCWALQEAITKLGHDVKVLDRWLDPKNETLNGNRVSGIKSLPFNTSLRSKRITVLLAEAFVVLVSGSYS